MAESLAAVGLVSAIVQFVDFTAKVIERLNEFHSRAKDAPQSFSDLKIRLPLLRLTLDTVCSQAKAKLVDPKAQEALLDVVSGCQAQVRVLDDILSRMLPAQGDGRVRRGMKALSSVVQEKTLRRVMDRIQEYKLNLIHHQTTFTTNFEGVNSFSPAYLSQHSGSEASQQQQQQQPPPPRDLNRMVRVHIDGGEFFAGKDLYLPASTCLTDLRKQLSNN